MPITIEVPAAEGWDPIREEFVPMKSDRLVLEHSLLSLSKWESKWKKPFLDPKAKRTSEEINDYVRCMTINSHVDPSVYSRLTREQVDSIAKYIKDPMTATWFNDKRKGKRDTRVMTSELFYCQMVINGIPFECEKWHLNRLITLIRVCNAENAPKKQMNKNDLYGRHMAAHAARRKPRKH